MAFDLFCKSVQGASHIKRGIPCEDYGLKYETDLCKVFVLGDGHGDPNCFRSSLGSKLICEIAVQELTQFAGALAEHEWHEQLFDRAAAEELITQLVTSIFGKWSCAVNDDFLQNPMTEQEAELAVDYIERYKNGERIEHIYGTTMIAGLLTDKYLLLLQQGDGRCVVFDEQGVATQPIPWDDRCFANVTTSVCDADAIQSCRYHIVNLDQTRITACAAGSDGVEDSFNSMDKMHSYYRKLLRIACDNGVDALECHLDETLPSFSEKGSGDDTTICGIIDASLFEENWERMVMEDEIIAVKDELSRAQERIDSMQNKLSFLKNKYASITEEYSRVFEKYTCFTENYEDAKQDVIKLQSAHSASKVFSAILLRRLQNTLEDMESEKALLDEELAQITAKKAAAEEELLPYEERYNSFVKMKNDAEQKLTALLCPKDASEDCNHC